MHIVYKYNDPKSIIDIESIRTFDMLNDAIIYYEDIALTNISYGVSIAYETFGYCYDTYEDCTTNIKNTKHMYIISFYNIIDNRLHYHYYIEYNSLNSALEAYLSMSDRSSQFRTTTINELMTNKYSYNDCVGDKITICIFDTKIIHTSKIPRPITECLKDIRYTSIKKILSINI